MKTDYNKRARTQENEKYVSLLREHASSTNSPNAITADIVEDLLTAGYDIDITTTRSLVTIVDRSKGENK